MVILVSACLLGENCKYNGGNNYNEKVIEHLKDKDVLPVCPEVLAGLGIPRTPIELIDGTAFDQDGHNVNEQIRQGIAAALQQIKKIDIAYAILQARSPSCGYGQIYDGSFSNRLIEGNGLFAQALIDMGCKVINTDDIE